MKIHIIGPGVVGKATGSLFARFGHSLIYTDKGDRHADVQADLHLVCVPEAAAPEIVRELAAQGHYEEVKANATQWVGGRPENEIIAVRSSVPPGTCQALSEELRRPVFHIPEFLREATAEADVLEAKQVIIGEPTSNMQLPWAELLLAQSNILASVYASFLGRSVTVTWSTETELLKLVNNSYLATLVSFWNQVQPIAEKLGVNSHHMGRLMVDNDPRITAYGALRHGKPYGGTCLPKDLAQLTKAGQDAVGMDYVPLLDAVKTINEGMKKCAS